MSFWMRLLALWNAILPYLGPNTITQVETAFAKAMTDFQGGDYAAAFNDLIEALKAILPSNAAPMLDDHSV